MEWLFKLSKQCKRCQVMYEEPEKHFTKNDKSLDKLNYWCNECKRKYREERGNTEHGYLNNLYNHMRGRIKIARKKGISDIESQKYIVHVTEQEFRELWEEHKKQFGLRCRLTGVKMVLEQSRTKKCGKKTRGFSNGMSVDRLDPTKGYTKENIIFVCNEINKIKSGITKELCIKILEIMKERNL